MGFKLTVTTQEKDLGVTADSSMKTSAPCTSKKKNQKNARLNKIKNNTNNVINATT